MKYAYLGILGILIALAVIVYSPVKKEVISVAPTPTVVPTLRSDRLWAIIQNWRTSHGLKAYIEDDRLCDIASKRIKAGNDQHKGFYAQYSTSPFELSENSVWDSVSEEHALTGWLNSPTHKDNLEKSYTYSCVVTDGNDALQIFSNFSK